jgi:diguanylate cyclase (GGDEF)-like protein/PAS domain S-box-containing protein
MLFPAGSLVEGAANNLLVLLGAAFLLSRGLAVVAGRPPWMRTALISAGFAVTAAIAMMLSFPIAPGVIGDLRNAVVAIAALSGGPVAALVTAAVAAAYRILLGGHWPVAVGGIAATVLIAVGFVTAKVPRRPANLAGLALVLAAVNASLPIAASLINPAGLADAGRIAAAILAPAAVLYPLTILLVGGFLSTELKRIDAEAALRSDNARLNENERRFREVFDLSSVAMAWGELATGRLVRVNAKYAELAGRSEAELLAMTAAELSPAEDRDAETAATAPLRAGKMTSLTGEKRYLRKDGTIVWGLRTLTVAREDGEPRYVFAMVQDITEQKRDQERIVFLAEHDSLTGLANRRMVYDRLDRAVSGLYPQGELAVLYVDLDDFKEVNDTLGHRAGDLLLTQIAERLKALAGAGDTLARLSGDGFAVLHPAAAGAEEGRELARQILALIGTPFEIKGRSVSLGASIGIAVAPGHGVSAAELFRKADIAIQAAKAGGRGGFRLFEPSMETDLRARQALKADLALALERRELAVEYQPIVSVATGEITAFEALCRWHHPEHGDIPPGRFIPVAEETGLIDQIGDFVLAEATAQAATWPGRIRLAVNVSPRQFQTRTLPLHVASTLLAADLSASRLELEITESVLVQASEANLAILHDLRRLGVAIVLDDFGTGYSALGYLRRFPIDRIKIDRVFVGDLPVKAESRAVVGAIIGLARALGMGVTAEGVETREQLAVLRDRACDDAQGYYFSRSVRAEAIPALIARLNRPGRTETSAPDGALSGMI